MKKKALDLIEFRLGSMKDDYFDLLNTVKVNTATGNFDNDHSDLRLLYLKEQALKELLEIKAIYKKRTGGKS